MKFCYSRTLDMDVSQDNLALRQSREYDMAFHFVTRERSIPGCLSLWKHSTKRQCSHQAWISRGHKKPGQEFRVPSDGHPANIDQFANPTDSCPAETAVVRKRRLRTEGAIFLDVGRRCMILPHSGSLHSSEIYLRSGKL